MMFDSAVLLRDHLVKLEDYVILIRTQDILRAIKYDPLPCPRGGLCQNVFTIARKMGYDYEERTQIVDLLRGLWQKWPEYSGDILFPVPGTRYFDKVSAHHAYTLCKRPWSRFTKYGRARRRLLDWLIEAVDNHES